MVTVVVGRCGEMRVEREPIYARRCAWCRTFVTEIDRAWAMEGAPVTDSICETCAGPVEAQEPKEAA